MVGALADNFRITHPGGWFHAARAGPGSNRRVLVPTLMILIGGGLMAIHLHGAAAGMVVVYGVWPIYIGQYTNTPRPRLGVRTPQIHLLYTNTPIRLLRLPLRKAMGGIRQVGQVQRHMGRHLANQIKVALVQPHLIVGAGFGLSNFSSTTRVSAFATFVSSIASEASCSIILACPSAAILAFRAASSASLEISKARSDSTYVWGS